jgi:acyl-coenzyme A synthetase/AMP-(fatty) acid ligase
MPVSFEPYPAWEWNIPEHFNIGMACLDAHLGTPTAERVAMVVEDQAAGTVEATYAELASRTSKFAQLLREHDIGLGERVLIRLPNSLDYPAAFLGAMKRGAVAVPTSTLLTAEEVLYLAKDSGAQVLVTDKAAWPALKDQLSASHDIRLVLLAGPGAIEKSGRKKTGPKILDLDAELKKIRTWGEAHLTRANDPAYLVYTSGTTGYPKGVLHAHRALLGRAPASRYWFEFAASTIENGAVDRIVHSGKFNWTYVLGSALMDPLYLGKTVIVYEGKNDAETWPKLIAKHSASIFIGVPTIYRQIIQKTALAKSDVPTLRYCMSAGEHLSDEMLQLWRERFGMNIFEAVGMSEFSYYLSQNPTRPIRPGSAGFPQPGHDIQLLDPETLKPVAPGEEGMICVPETDPGLFLQPARRDGEAGARRMVFHRRLRALRR